MRRFLTISKFLAAAVFAFLLLLWPGQALVSAQNAMRVWAFSVAPALFPFLALLPTLTCSTARRAYEKLFGWLMRPLFRLPGSAAAAVVTGMIAGSPAGALAAVKVCGGMRKGEFKRMALMGSGVGPVYLMSGVGAALFCSVELGAWLVGAQLVAQILLGIALRGWFQEEGELLSEPESVAAEKPIRAAVGNILQVCGYMVSFSVAAGLLSRLAGEKLGNALLYFLDLPSGIAAAAVAREGYALLGLIAGFGGLCIAAQNMAILKPLGVRWGEYLSARAVCAAISSGALYLRFQVLAPQAVPALAALPAAPVFEISMLVAVLLAAPAAFFLAKGQNS